MELALVGISHRTAPIQIREQLAFAESGVVDALQQLRREYHFQEGLILSTCNRVEVLGSTESALDSAAGIREFLSDYHQLDLNRLEPHIYELDRRSLVEHVFRVASSLDSMVVGEAQILGQVKRAYQTACDVGLAGSLLHGLLPHAFFTAKRVRAETRIGHSAVSVSSVAVELARQIFTDLSGKTVLLLGAGEMSELAARSLAGAGSRVLVANRSADRARAVAESLGGASVPFSEFVHYLPLADIILVSTSADAFVVTPEHMSQALRERRHRPTFIIDISVPRNVDPAVNRIDDAFLYDIDDLQSVVAVNREARGAEAAQAEEIIAHEAGRFLTIGSRAELGSRIVELRQWIEELCLAELNQNREELDPAEYERLRRAMLRSAHRIAHPIIVELKERDIPREELARRLNDAIREPDEP